MAMLGKEPMQGWKTMSVMFGSEFVYSVNWSVGGESSHI